MMKLLSFFGKKVKSRASERYSNPFAEFLSGESPRRSSERCPPSSVNFSVVHQRDIERRRGVVDELFEIQDQELSEAFRIIDKNGDGKISKEELGTMWKALGERVTDRELTLMVEELDQNGDGEIDILEFASLNTTVGLATHDPDTHAEELRVAFCVADANRDGHISAAELQNVMKRLGMKKVSLAESSAMLKIAGSNFGGLINFEHFAKLMTSSIFTKHGVL